MNFSQAIASGFSNYVNFSTRAARSEFWYWALFCFIVGAFATFLDFAVFMDFDIETLLDTTFSPFNSIVSLALLLPNIAVGIRRLHDLDRTGWWLLIIFTIIGVFLLLAWFCIKGTEGTNRFGPDPLG